MAAIIRIENFSYRYPASPAQVLQNVNCEVNAGEFILVLGKSGSGKSTLGRAINGLIPHYFDGSLQGKVVVDDQEVARTPIWKLARVVGTVFQNPEVQMFTSRVEEELALAPENFGLPVPEIGNRVTAVLKALGITSLRDQQLKRLSCGQVQRVAIGSALTLLSPVLLFDEATANLDAEGLKSFVRILRSLRNKGQTIIAIDHRPGLLLPLADRVFLMAGGELSRIVPPPELQTNQLLCRQFAVKVPPTSGRQKRAVHNDGLLPVVLKVEDLSFAYGKEVILKNVNFWLRQGECLGIVGANGSGKTTLARILAGLLTPGGGYWKIPPGGIGLVLQNPDRQLFFPTVYEEVAFSATPETATELLKELDLWAFRHRHPQTLSQGQKQRVTIAAALARRPEVLILDEPTTGMDSDHLRELISVLARFRNDGLALVLISHDMEFLEAISNRLSLLEQGRLKTLRREHVGMDFATILDKAAEEEIDAKEALFLLEHSDSPAEALRLFSVADRVRRQELGDKLRWTAGIAQFLPCRLPVLCRYCTSFTNRALSPQTVRKAIVYIAEAGIPDVHLSGGANLAGYDEEIIDLIRGIREFSAIPLEVNLGPSICYPETLQELKKLGVTSITCSLETNNEALFRRVKPGDDLQARRRLLEMAAAAGLKTNGMLLVGLGETLSDRIQHLFYLKQFPNFVNLRLSRYYPFPQTPLATLPRTSPWEVARLMAVARLVWRRLDIGPAAGNSVDDLPLYFAAGGGNRLLGIHVQERKPHPAPGVKIVDLDGEAVIVDRREIVQHYVKSMDFRL